VGYVEVAHTADLALRIWGSSLGELLASAAEGLFASVPPGCGPRVERRLTLTAEDVETLLVDWLSELLYLSEAKRETYDTFTVTVEPGLCLSATIRGTAGANERPRVKAVTYHGLCVEQVDGVYAATLVFDT